MKLIFLDHDGVICLSNNWGGRFKKQHKWGGRKLSMTSLEIPLEYRFDNFNKKSIKILNEILETTGAEIIVSSDWKKWATLEEMGEYYLSQGITKKPIGFTDSLLYADYNEFSWSKKFDSEQTRSFEIKECLKIYPKVTHWVAIDDLDMSIRKNENGEYSWGLDNFVHTSISDEGIKQCGIKEKIIKFLND